MRDKSSEDQDVFKLRVLEKSRLLNELISSDDHIGEISSHIEWIPVLMDNLVISLLASILLDSDTSFDDKVKCFDTMKENIMGEMEDKFAFGKKRLWEHSNKG